ncbi:MAG: hypothetical protein J0G29_02315 [Alphaproteobacteria bacterium]|nr:hypothetical protein [Alphaproteobacteria bacterium]OJV45688.1 MAG: hypothetical protein BGO28_02405 [Alphaproteobacteria bacterium 43-37]
MSRRFIFLTLINAMIMNLVHASVLQATALDDDDLVTESGIATAPVFLSASGKPQEDQFNGFVDRYLTLMDQIDNAKTPESSTHQSYQILLQEMVTLLGDPAALNAVAEGLGEASLDSAIQDYQAQLEAVTSAHASGENTILAAASDDDEFAALIEPILNLEQQFSHALKVYQSSGDRSILDMIIGVAEDAVRQALLYPAAVELMQSQAEEGSSLRDLGAFLNRLLAFKDKPGDRKEAVLASVDRLAFAFMRLGKQSGQVTEDELRGFLKNQQMTEQAVCLDVGLGAEVENMDAVNSVATGQSGVLSFNPVTFFQFVEILVEFCSQLIATTSAAPLAPLVEGNIVIPAAGDDVSAMEPHPSQSSVTAFEAGVASFPESREAEEVYPDQFKVEIPRAAFFERNSDGSTESKLASIPLRDLPPILRLIMGKINEFKSIAQRKMPSNAKARDLSRVADEVFALQSTQEWREESRRLGVSELNAAQALRSTLDEVRAEALAEQVADMNKRWSTISKVKPDPDGWGFWGMAAAIGLISQGLFSRTVQELEDVISSLSDLQLYSPSLIKIKIAKRGIDFDEFMLRLQRIGRDNPELSERLLKSSKVGTIYGRLGTALAAYSGGGVALLEAWKVARKTPVDGGGGAPVAPAPVNGVPAVEDNLDVAPPVPEGNDDGFGDHGAADWHELPHEELGDDHGDGFDVLLPHDGLSEGDGLSDDDMGDFALHLQQQNQALINYAGGHAARAPAITENRLMKLQIAYHEARIRSNAGGIEEAHQRGVNAAKDRLRNIYAFSEQQADRWLEKNAGRLTQTYRWSL